MWIDLSEVILIIDSRFRLVQVSSAIRLNFNIHAHKFRLESPSNARCKCSKLFKILVHPLHMICSRDMKNQVLRHVYVHFELSFERYYCGVNYL